MSVLFSIHFSNEFLKFSFPTQEFLFVSFFGFTPCFQIPLRVDKCRGICFLPSASREGFKTVSINNPYLFLGIRAQQGLLIAPYLEERFDVLKGDEGVDKWEGTSISIEITTTMGTVCLRTGFGVSCFAFSAALQ